MEAKRKRLTLDLAPTSYRWLKGIAALKGVSMRAYCQAAIDRELTRDEATGSRDCYWTSRTMRCLQSSGATCSAAAPCRGAPST